MSIIDRDEALLLKSKLYVPAAPEKAVHRVSLTTRLNKGLKQKATLILAPAGYGKTTLVSEWVRQVDRSCAWLSLDEGDNDVVRFWQYVLAAIEQAMPGFINDSEGSSSFVPNQVKSLLVKLLNAIEELPAPLLLVLDDWHFIHDPRVTESMSFFVEYVPSNLHLCFVSRRSPDGFKARWLSRGWMNKLEADNLRFTLEEAITYIHNHQLMSLTSGQIQNLLHKTEGWVTGLKLAILTLRGRESNRLFHILESTLGPVDQFLSEEVLEALPDSERNLLLKLSLLHRFNPDLCARLSCIDSDAPSLQKLVDANLFLIALDDTGRWYRLHHWFRSFLQQRLNHYLPGAEPELYKQAAKWCEEQELIEEAIDYYLAGRHYTEALRLLERLKSFMIRGQFSTLRRWLSQLPQSLLQSHRHLYFSFIFSLLWDNKPDEAEAYLQRAEKELGQNSRAWTPEERNRFAGDLYFVRNFKATQFDMDMIKGLEYIQLSLTYNPNGTDLIFASPHTSLAPSIYRSYNGKRGRHLPREVADSFFQSMIAFMQQMGIEEAIEVCYGELLYERNELDQAELYLKKGLAKSARTRHEPEKVYIPALLFLTRIGLARGSRIDADRWLETAKKKVSEKSDLIDAELIFIEAEEALWKLDEGDEGPSLRWRTKYGLTSEDPMSVDQLFVYQALAKMLAGVGELDEAWRLAGKLLLIAIKDHRPMDALAIQIFQAILQKRLNKQEEALLLIEDSLLHAEPDDYIRVFVDLGKPAAELLREYIQMRQKGLLRDRIMPSLHYVRKVLAGFDGHTNSFSLGENALEVLLTKRELTVYRCMEEGLDNRAITERLGIGMGTLKSHINRIYSKLQVPSRIEAIHRGRELQEKSEGKRFNDYPA